MAHLPYAPGNRVQITSPYGQRIDPITGAVNTWHGGVDIVGLDDKTLTSPVNGVVLVSQIVTDKNNRTSEWGNYICIRGEDTNLYYLCHMESRAVFANQFVETGDFIGFEGSTGYSTGSHCHLEVRDSSGKQIDPTPLFGIKNEAGMIYTIPDEDDEEETMDNKTHTWSEEAVKWALENGIMQGNEKGDLMLRKNATREQIAVMLYRLYKLLQGEK